MGSVNSVHQWVSPPSDYFYGAVDDSRVVASTDDSLVALLGISTYSNGCILTYSCASRGWTHGSVVPEGNRAILQSLVDNGPLGSAPYFECCFSDGTKVDTVAGGKLFMEFAEGSVELPRQPLLRLLTGSRAVAGPSHICVEQRLWLSPLPDSGCTISVTWGNYGIVKQDHVIDGLKIAEGASKVRPFWSS